MLVLAGAHPAPFRGAGRQRGTIDPLVPITDFGCFRPPQPSVTGGFANQSVSDFVQQNLLDLIEVSGC